MINNNSCNVAIVFLSAMIYLKLFSDKNNIINEFKNSLPEELKYKYEQISNERRNIHLQGLVYGLLIAIILLYGVPNKIRSGRICFVVATILIFSHIFYIVYPKSDHIILYLNDPKDRERWLTVYNHMQRYYYIGLIIGLLIISIKIFIL